jgi:hypothetical protein
VLLEGLRAHVGPPRQEHDHLHHVVPPLPIGAADPAAVVAARDASRRRTQSVEHLALPRPAAGTAYPSDGPGAVNARHRLPTWPDPVSQGPTGTVGQRPRLAG